RGVVVGEAGERGAPPVGGAALRGGGDGVLEAACLHQVAHPLPSDPGVTWQEAGRATEPVEQASPRRNDVVVFRRGCPAVTPAAEGEAEAADPLVAPPAAARPRLRE